MSSYKTHYAVLGIDFQNTSESRFQFFSTLLRRYGRMSKIAIGLRGCVEKRGFKYSALFYRYWSDDNISVRLNKIVDPGIESLTEGDLRTLHSWAQEMDIDARTILAGIERRMKELILRL